MQNIKIPKRNRILKVAIILVAVVSAVYYIKYIWTKTENDQIQNNLQIARSIEASIVVKDLNSLSISPEDVGKVQYQKIKEKLQAIIKVNPEAKFAYIWVEKDGKLLFVADSEPETSEDYSPPGQEYTEATDEDWMPFRKGKK